MTKKHALKIEYMQREFKACIATTAIIVATSPIFALGITTPCIFGSNDDILDQLIFIVFAICVAIIMNHYTIKSVLVLKMVY